MTRSRVLVRAGALVLAVAVGTACGGDDGRFDDHVAQVRAAIDAGDHAAAEKALDDLAIAALVAHEEGAIDDAEVEEVASLIESSQALLGEVVAKPPETTAETAPATDAPTTEPPPPVVDDGSDDDEGGGKGKGKGDKDGDDD